MDTQPEPTTRRQVSIGALIVPIGAVIVAAVIGAATAYIFWLHHPSGPDASTRIDDSLYRAHFGHCGDPGWTRPLLLATVAAFLAAPVLLVVGGVLLFRRRYWSGASFAVIAVMAFVFSVVAYSFGSDVVAITVCD